MATRYVIITPARNEERYITHTLNSVCKQTLTPHQWIIVDDGSSDKTPSIVYGYAKRNPWIKLIKNNTFDEKRAGGPKVVRAFYDGYYTITERNYDFIVKLDADLTLPHNYFEVVAKCFQANTKVGLCGGYCVNEKNGKLTKEKTASYHVRGAFKAYRKECFDDIGGLKQVWDWDGLDQMTAMYLGWEIRVLPLAVIHYRETSKEYNRILHSFRSGKEYYKMGHDLFLGLVKSIVLVAKRPFFLRGIFFLIGFLVACAKKENRIVDNGLAKFIRKFQYDRIKRAPSKFIRKLK